MNKLLTLFLFLCLFQSSIQAQWYTRHHTVDNPNQITAVQLDWSEMIIGNRIVKGSAIAFFSSVAWLMSDYRVNSSTITSIIKGISITTCLASISYTIVNSIIYHNIKDFRKSAILEKIEIDLALIQYTDRKIYSGLMLSIRF